MWLFILSPGAWGLVKLLSFIPLLVMNNAAKLANRRLRPDSPENKRLGFGLWIVVTFGGVGLLIVLAGAWMGQSGMFGDILENSSYAPHYDELIRGRVGG
jgi:hypothetical protein